MTELFAKSETRTTFRSRSDKLIEAIKSFSDEKILGADFDEWVQYYFEVYKIYPLKLFLDNVSQSLSETTVKRHNPFGGHDSYEPQYYNIDGYKITYTIPFDGDNSLLYLQPSTRFLTRFLVECVKSSSDDSYGEIVFSLEYTKQELDGKDALKEFVASQFTQKFKNYIETINRINEEVEIYNSGLEFIIREALENRKQKASNYVALGEKLDIPLKINPKAPNTNPILLKKAIIKKPEIPSAKMPEKEYQIKAEDYEKIRQIINLAGFSMEKAARTFSKLDEEELRDIIISHLNTHFQGLASAETFSKVGKTDIHILFENKAAYIAECKIWHGEKKLHEAIEQLFSYITWRDAKTSIIIFNKDNKDFEKILKVIGTYLDKNDMCQKSVKLEHNEWLCEFRKDSASSNHIVVQIVIFDMCLTPLLSE